MTLRQQLARLEREREAKRGGKALTVLVDIETRKPFTNYDARRIEQAKRDGREVVTLACQRALWLGIGGNLYKIDGEWVEKD